MIWDLFRTLGASSAKKRFWSFKIFPKWNTFEEEAAKNEKRQVMEMKFGVHIDRQTYPPTPISMSFFLFRSFLDFGFFSIKEKLSKV